MKFIVSNHICLGEWKEVIGTEEKHSFHAITIVDDQLFVTSGWGDEEGEESNNTLTEEYFDSRTKQWKKTSFVGVCKYIMAFNALLIY